MRTSFFLSAIVVALPTMVACKKEAQTQVVAEAPSATTSTSSAPTEVASPPSPYDRGKKVYRSQCIACHAFDPRKIGSTGPDVYASSEELLRERVLNASYPKGYKPKRATRQMIKLPHLKDEIAALAVYLNSPDPMK